MLAIPILVAAFGACVCAAPPAASRTARLDGVLSLSADLKVQRNGSVRVKETIIHDFEDARQYGIDRGIYYVDFKGNRRISATNFTVSSPSGAPSKFEVEDTGYYKTVRIGEPGRAVTGRQTYILSYDLERALSEKGDHIEFLWDLTNGWNAGTISTATIRVTAPKGITEGACYTNPLQTPESACDKAGVFDSQGLFQDGDLREDANGTDATLLIAVKLPRDGVTVQPPEYLPPLKDPSPIVDQSEFEGPFEKAEFWRPTGVTLVIVIAAMAVVAIIWLILGPRRGRGRRTSAESMRPPGGLRPAAAALLLTGRTTALDFAATILDLARRGHLGIDVQDPSYRRWRLVSLAELGSDAEEAEEYEEYEEYERTLLAALFQANDVVMLDELRYSGFRAASSEIRRQIVGSAVRKGRLRGIPDDLRRVFVLLPAGIGPILVSTLLFGSPAALSAIGGIIGATAMLAAAIVISVMGYRAVPCTAAGTELRREIMAYWHHLTRADMSPDEVLEHLPYAVAFGHAALWQRHLDAAGAIATDPVRLGDRRALAGIDVLIGGGLNSFVRGAQLAMPPPAAFPASLASHIHGEWR